MAGHEQDSKSRVVKLDSEHAWNFFMARAKAQECPVAVHFAATWCMPSVAMKPFFEEMALSYQDILFLSVDVDEAKGVAAKMEIKAMPTFVLIKDGVQEADRVVGANPVEIKKRIHGFILKIRNHNKNKN